MMTNSPTKYEIHPAADVFPVMTEEEFAGLLNDMREHGQRDNGIVRDGKIIDGRNRYRACQILGIEFQFYELDPGDDPISYVVSANLHRRNLTRKQRNEVIEKLRTTGKTCQQIADATGVNKSTVSRVVANATTESPVTVKGKDGKAYPARKRRQPKPPKTGWCSVCRECTESPEATVCSKCASENPAAPAPALSADASEASTILCPVCECYECGPVAGRCEECIKKDRHPDDAVPDGADEDDVVTNNPQQAFNLEEHSNRVRESIEFFQSLWPLEHHATLAEILRRGADEIENFKD